MKRSRNLSHYPLCIWKDLKKTRIFWGKVSLESSFEPVSSRNAKQGQTVCAVDRFIPHPTAIFTAPVFYTALSSLLCPKKTIRTRCRMSVLIRAANIFVINDGGGNHMMVQRCEMTNYYSGAKDCRRTSDCIGCPKTLFYLFHYVAI